jgi:hypothetical protein
MEVLLAPRSSGRPGAGRPEMTLGIFVLLLIVDTVALGLMQHFRILPMNGESGPKMDAGEY